MIKETILKVNNNDVLFDFYDFNNGFSTSIITPFYIGHAKAHLNISSFKGKEYPFVNFRNISSDLFWLNQKEITVPGSHFIQEDSADLIGEGILDCLESIQY